jgi:hypothetical protein
MTERTEGPSPACPGGAIDRHGRLARRRAALAAAALAIAALGIVLIQQVRSRARDARPEREPPQVVEPAARADDAWRVVCRPDRPAREYFDALAEAERAVERQPSDAKLLSTLAAAQYRVEHFGDALSTTARCRAVRDEAGEPPYPGDVAIEAMALAKLERPDEARVRLTQARALAAAPVWAGDDDVRALVSEAASLVER